MGAKAATPNLLHDWGRVLDLPVQIRRAQLLSLRAGRQSGHAQGERRGGQSQSESFH